MLIIWKGIGGVVLIIPIIACLVINIVTSKVFDENNYFQAHLWPKLVALGISGVSCFLLGKYVNSRAPRIVIDEKTGRKIEEKPNHHLMFIKVEYWGIMFVGIGLALLLVNLASK